MQWHSPRRRATYFAVTACKRRRRSIVRGAKSDALAPGSGLTALRRCCCLNRLRLGVGSLRDANHDQRHREAGNGKAYPQIAKKLGNRVEDAFRFCLLRRLAKEQDQTVRLSLDLLGLPRKHFYSWHCSLEEDLLWRVSHQLSLLRKSSQNKRTSAI